MTPKLRRNCWVAIDVLVHRRTMSSVAAETEHYRGSGHIGRARVEQIARGAARRKYKFEGRSPPVSVCREIVSRELWADVRDATEDPDVIGVVPADLVGDLRNLPSSAPCQSYPR